MIDEQVSTALVPVSPAHVQLGTLEASSPEALVAGASEMATVLAGVIERQKLYVNIQGKRHVKVEGWTTLSTMLGCLPREIDTKALEDGSYISTVELVRMSDGVAISRATAECGMDEQRWSGMPRYARRSMAATRATSKVCRQAFSWIIALAGFEPTPAEEMNFETARPPVQQPRRKSAAPEPPPHVIEQEPQPPPVEGEAPPGPREFGGKVEGVEERKGKTGKQFWLLNVASPTERMEFRTFDTKVHEHAVEAQRLKETVIVAYTTDQYGHKATAIESLPF